MMNWHDLRDGIESLRESVMEGWERMRRNAASALTRFRPGAQSNLPLRNEIDDAGWLPQSAWSLLGGDVFEDDRRVVVRIEAPGMNREDMDIEVFDDHLEVRGEKRFDSEQNAGRWRLLQCAYGRFERSIALPAAVRADEARATYRRGVLRIELPKREPGRLRVRHIPVN
jgi:HSP20 family protein